MERIYYVSEFFNETMTSFRTYEQAMDAFNHALAERGKQLIKQPKSEKVLSVSLGSSYLQLWFMTYSPDLTVTENID